MKKTNIIIATTCCVALTVSSLVYAQRPDASGRLGQGGVPSRRKVAAPTAVWAEREALEASAVRGCRARRKS